MDRVSLKSAVVWITFGVVFFCGVLVPGIALRMERGRAVEFVTAHAALIVRWFTSHRHVVPMTTATLTPFLQMVRAEPGVEAIWVVDALGTVVARVGHLDERELQIAREATAMERLRIAEGPSGILYFSERLPQGAVGVRFSPSRAIAALAVPVTRVWYLVAAAGMGGWAILWSLRRQRLSNNPHRASERKESTRAGSAAVEWTRPMAEALPQSVAIFNARQQCVAANAVALARGWIHPADEGRHLLDIAERLPWGPAVLELIDMVSHHASPVVHRPMQSGAPALSIVRLHRDEELIGYWLLLHDGRDEASESPP